MINPYRSLVICIDICDIMGTKLDEVKFTPLPVSTMKKIGGLDIFDLNNNDDIKHTIMDIFPEDSIKNLKDKIYIATGIMPCEQCLIYEEKILSHVIMIGNTEFVPERTTEEINGIPINKTLYNMRENIKIIDLEYMTLENYEIDVPTKQSTGTPTLHIECRSLKTVHGHLANMERHNLELVYWSLIIYFPYFSLEALSDYAKQIYDRFPLLFPSIDSTQSRYGPESAYLNAMYDLFDGGASESDLKKYNLSLIDGVNNKHANLRFNIVELTILIQKRGLPNLENLFTLLATSEKVPVIVYASRTLCFTKVYYRFENKIPLNIFKNKNYRPSVSVIIGTTIFEITENGHIFANIITRVGETIDFKSAEKIIEESSMIFYKLLDDLQISVFKNDVPIDYYEIMKINTSLSWIVNLPDFDQFVKTLRATQMIQPRDESSRFHFMKGAQYEENESWNEFEYLINADVAHTPVNYFEILNKFSEIVFITHNMTQYDFKNFIKFIIYHLYHLKSDNSEKIGLNNLKRLRAEDPKNYNIGKMGNNKVYASFCQKPKQPIPVSESEVGNYKNKERLMKFWNYTKEEPMWYYCPNDKFPIPGFSVGYHPDNNCLICCRMKNNVGKKYKKIYDECMSTHKYLITKDTSQVRYVINFGKVLEEGRLGNLPDLVNKFLVYNMEDINIISETTTMQLFRYQGRIYSIDRLTKVTKDTRIESVPMALLENFLSIPVWREKRQGEESIRPIDIIKNPDLNKKHKKYYKRIMSTDVTQPIFVYYDVSAEKYIVVDGSNRLAHAFIKNLTHIPTKFITKKQLERVYMGKYNMTDISFLPEAIEIEKKGGNDTEPFYYMVGVAQSFNSNLAQRTNNDLMIGYFTSIAAAYEMELVDFIKDVISRLHRVEYVSNYNSADLIERLTNTFIKMIPSEMMDWNSVASDILPILYHYIPIILEYSNAANIGLIIQNHYENWTDDEFIILLKADNTYNPIFIVIPYIYSKKKLAEKRIYNYDDKIIRLLETLAIKTNHTADFTLSRIVEMKEYKTVKTYEIGGYVYAVELALADSIADKNGHYAKSFYISIDQIKVQKATFDKITLGTYDLNTSRHFLEEYSKKYGIALNIECVYINAMFGSTRSKNTNERVVAYRINGQVNFVSCDLDQFTKIYGTVPIEYWNYAPEIIMNARDNREDPILARYFELNNKRNDYIHYKEEYLRKNPKVIENISLIKPKSEYEQALYEELQNPLKRKLFRSGIYNFQKIFLNKQKNENIYVKYK